MKIPRFFTRQGQDPSQAFEYEKRDCKIQNPDGSVVFEMHDIEVPRKWSVLASNILISKYVRKAGVPETGHEKSVRQVVGRLVSSLRHAGEAAGGYFETPEDAEAFEQEMTHVLLDQRGAFNSPVWFNLGLYHQYDIKGGKGNWCWDAEKGDVRELDNNYERPQCSACFIQSIQDDLMSIFDLIKSEARIFKYGSGSGTNFSVVRGRQEKLSGGGTSSGLMSFLEVFDKAAGATKSGGTTRRAAKMVCLDADHPEIRDFVAWKRVEEEKARALIREGYPNDFNGEAYHTVSGQNGNNSVRLSDAFMKKCKKGEIWETRLRTTGEVCETFPARELMREICESAWECADPGVQFDSTINAWHTCPNTGPIRSSNPCSEYMFLDDSACNLASINLMKYLREDGTLDVEAFRHTVRLFIIAQEILVDSSSYPTPRIARNSHLFRPLGLGYANLGSLLMARGLPYDSDAGRALAGAITAMMTGRAYAVSAEIASRKGPFEGYALNREPMLRVMGKHRDALESIDDALCPEGLLAAAREDWNLAIEQGEDYGYRNAQVSVLAPTGTIGLLMDCDTTGIEPDFALVKFKKLAGGGYFKIVNRTVPLALQHLGYEESQIKDIVEFMQGTQRLEGAPHINPASLGEKGLNAEDIDRLDKALPGAYDLNQAVSSGVFTEEALARLGIKDGSTENILTRIGFTEEQIEEASRVICGAMTVEGAPYLSQDHYAVFDCASTCGPEGTRQIVPVGHIKMMAATQPFLSGAISKTVNLPRSASVEDIETIYRMSWELGLKAVALYRDGCKGSQPLSASAVQKKDEAAKAPEDGQLELFPELAEYGPKQRPLPGRRRGITVESRVGGHKVFLRTGEYDDGTVGEIFVDMHKEGSSFRSMMMCYAMAVSMGLQYGVPLSKFVDTFTFTSFEPNGMCDHPNIKMASSVIDYVFRVLGLEYLGRTDLCQVKPESADDTLVAPAVKGPFGRNGDDAPPLTLPETQTRKERYANGAPAGKRAASALDKQMSAAGDGAPFCDICGHLTVRNGTCHKCLNCGHSMGCS